MRRAQGRTLDADAARRRRPDVDPRRARRGRPRRGHPAVRSGRRRDRRPADGRRPVDRDRARAHEASARCHERRPDDRHRHTHTDPAVDGWFHVEPPGTARPPVQRVRRRRVPPPNDATFCPNPGCASVRHSSRTGWRPERHDLVLHRRPIPTAAALHPGDRPVRAVRHRRRRARRRGSSSSARSSRGTASTISTVGHARSSPRRSRRCYSDDGRPPPHLALATAERGAAMKQRRRRDHRCRHAPVGQVGRHFVHVRRRRRPGRPRRRRRRLDRRRLRGRRRDRPQRLPRLRRRRDVRPGPRLVRGAGGHRLRGVRLGRTGARRGARPGSSPGSPTSRSSSAPTPRPRASSPPTSASVGTIPTGCASACSGRPTRRTSGCTPAAAWTCYGATVDDFAQVKVKNARHGLDNPIARYRKVVTVEEVGASPWSPTRCGCSTSAPRATAAPPLVRVLSRLRPAPRTRRPGAGRGRSRR